ncbi:MAG: hypothetical protein QOH56_4443 [Pseudonocardiales bacterium]|nr:hypothetical protein [Pseudonocardiales bacterium]
MDVGLRVTRVLWKSSPPTTAVVPACAVMNSPLPARRPPESMTEQRTGAATAARRGPANDDPDPPQRRLNEAATVLWRSVDTVQFELGTRRIIVENVGSEQLVSLLPRRAKGLGSGAELDPETPNANEDDLHQLREVLDRSGFLSSERARDRSTDRAQPLSAYLMPDLAALAGEFGSESSQILRARRETAVAVHGTTRLAVSVAATLAASGVGWVQLVNGGDVSAADACPGGLTPADEGRRFGVAAADAVRRAAPDVDTTPIPHDRSADLVILTDPGPADSAVRSSLHLDGLVHLAVSVIGLRAVVGPLVRPGVSSCLRCADLHRSDRDPVWPALAVQLSGSGRRRSASNVGLCVAAAGLAATQALAYLDRQWPATIDGTLEWQLPDWRLRRRTWPAHHGCDCGASAESVRARQNRNVIFR